MKPAASLKVVTEKCAVQVHIGGLLDAKSKLPHCDQFIFEDSSLVPY